MSEFRQKLEALYQKSLPGLTAEAEGLIKRLGPIILGDLKRAAAEGDASLIVSPDSNLPVDILLTALRHYFKDLNVDSATMTSKSHYVYLDPKEGFIVNEPSGKVPAWNYSDRPAFIISGWATKG